MKTMINIVKATSLMFTLVLAQPAISAEDNVATLRGEAKLDNQVTPKPIAKVQNNDIKKSRNYPMQPPVIPHKIRNYEVNLNTNKCMSCHSRNRTQESQAPMISVTHYMDRDGNFLAEMSPRRYFCSQCHATQTDAKPLVENTFVDMHSLMKAKQTSSQ